MTPPVAEAPQAPPRPSARNVSTAGPVAGRPGQRQLSAATGRRVAGEAVAERLGVCQWFHFEDHLAVDQVVAKAQALGLRHLRTGVSWADYHRPGGVAWYDTLLGRLHDAGLTILLSVWHTPPSLSEGGSCSSPPRRLRDYADFIDLLIRRHGRHFETLELWNEPNNRIKWNFIDFDPRWRKFGEMIGAAAYWAKQCQVRTVLGGMIPVDPHWLGLMHDYGVMDYIDVVGIHAFPGMWQGDAYWWDWPEEWRGWQAKVDSVRDAADGRPIWVTETGYANWCPVRREPHGYLAQARHLARAARAPAERVYWYCLVDLHERYPCIEQTEDGGRVDEREYHMGLYTQDLRPKPAALRLARSRRVKR